MTPLQLTLEELRELADRIPKPKLPEKLLINPEDYRRMREAADIFRICPEQPGGFTFGFMGERISPDDSIPPKCYKFISKDE